MPRDVLEINEEMMYDKILKEFNKNKQDVLECTEIIKKWIDTQPHFPETATDNMIRSLLIYNKFSIEKTKQKLNMYYTIRNIMPELFSAHPLSPEMILQSKVTYCIPLPKLPPDAVRIIYSRINPDYDPELFNHEKYVNHIHNVIEILVQEDLSLKYHFVFDCKGIKLGHIPKFSPMVIKKVVIVLEKVFSNRVSSVFLVNFTAHMESILNMLKPLLAPKIQARIRVHSDVGAMMDIFSKSVLPKDVGGDEESLEELNERWLKKFEEYKSRFDKLVTMRVDESLRPTTLINDEILGYYGNFKKIDVD